MVAVPAAPPVTTVHRAAIDRRAGIRRGIVWPVVTIASGVGCGDGGDGAEQPDNRPQGNGIAVAHAGLCRRGAERSERNRGRSGGGNDDLGFWGDQRGKRLGDLSDS